MKLIEDDKGNTSSLRVILLVLAGVFVYFTGLFSYVLLVELHKESGTNYTGLVSLFTAMFISFLLAIFAKVLQKKYENSK